MYDIPDWEATHCGENSTNQIAGPASQWRMQIRNMFTEYSNLFPWGGDLENISWRLELLGD